MSLPSHLMAAGWPQAGSMLFAGGGIREASPKEDIWGFSPFIFFSLPRKTRQHGVGVSQASRHFSRIAPDKSQAIRERGVIPDSRYRRRRLCDKRGRKCGEQP